jgi:Bacterial Ig-like domain (group 2)/Electron transfer DM13
MKKIILFAAVAVAFTACKKSGEVVPLAEVVTVPEFLDIAPSTNSKLIGETAQFTLKYFNNTGVLAPTPSTGITWISSNPNVASINQQGLATALTTGQTFIKATYNNVTSTSALLTIVANNNTLSTITITPNGTKEILLNGTTSLSAVGTNLAGGVMSGLNFTWGSTNSPIVQISPSGVATGLLYGNSNITASSNGIQSAPTTIQVIRQGTFVGSNSAGMVKLKFENGNLVLQTTSTFSVSTSPPDLRIYLSNNATNITGGTQIAALTTASQTSGARSWNVPASVSITQFRYAVVWCAQFPSTYGVADFGL